MGNVISGRKTTEQPGSGTTDPSAVAMDELTKDVERLKAAMEENDRTIYRLDRTVEEIRVSLPPTPYLPKHNKYYVPTFIVYNIIIIKFLS